ncbi:MAG TPA: aquaporin Z [Blastocatellia bacterium]|nr:aquaporin Z [Blastocatellia bacterium]
MKKYLAELIGTFVLVFGGCGSAVLAGDKIGFLGVSIAFGLTLLTMAYAIGPISGCHINPAVTIGLLLSKKFDPRDAAGYIGAQIIGGVLAAALLLAIAQGAVAGYDPAVAGFAANGYGAHSPAHYSLTAGFLTEVILTFLLVFTVLGATDIEAPVGFAGIPIGFVLVLIHLVGIPVTNTSVNPARSIGPAVFVGGWALSQLWLFILAPIVGAIFAAVVWRVLGTTRPIISTEEAEQALYSEVAERRRQ